jgi:general secretion pathway protein G
LKEIEMNLSRILKRAARNDGGFTLIELILVTVIIAVLAGMVTLALRGVAQDSKIRAALGDIKSYQTAIDLFALDHNDQFPKTLDDLVNGQKKYLRDMNKDPWGRPYVYIVPGKHYPDSFDLLSMGPDGQQGTQDDVAPWLVKSPEESK